ncbi:hypothetical protein NLI96_g2713 [Meripilus lineatus]|uniref:GH16 domain-containing protein n=1 Tax=Meripilus lineatus TaxID=2056292 RepID=A0AAD5V8C2_9APHY|nr:hypothetical protein NLI96_g2713 [Physisporinus lineatus]
MSRPPTAAPSVISSTSSISTTSSPDHGTKRDHPPSSLFIDRRATAAEMDDSRVDPFQSPESSVPPTPRSQATNPFSAPPSIVSFGDQHVTRAPPAHLERSHSSHYSSRFSVHSSLRNSTTELSLRDARPRLSNKVTSQIRDSFMSPPVLARRATVHESTSTSRASIAAPKTKRPRSTMLTSNIEKPWIGKRETYATVSYFLTYGVTLIGAVGSALLCYFAWRNVPRVGNLCLVMEDNFDTFDTQHTWQHEVDMGGFGNGEFEMATNSLNNSFVKDGQLYIVPTLTSDVIGLQSVFDGYTYNITGCTNKNLTACGAVSNMTTGAVINPVMSARLTTKNSHHIQFGKVEVVAKLPRGDWLWPAISMLPLDNTYGAWPLSGEIDIMQARGNSPEYKGQGIDYVRGSLSWGPFAWLNGVSKTFGAWTDRRKTYNQGFHTFSVEWTPKFMRIYVDSRLHHLVDLRFNIPFFQRGNFPKTVANGSEWIVTPNPWKDGTIAAPFDRPFYLVLDVAVGGTNGWFPDGLGDKPWLDGSLTAMRDFAKAQNEWYATWPENIAERAMVVDSVKMWQLC